MCGRFTLTAEEEEIKERFNVELSLTGYEKRYNISPSQQVLAIINDGMKNRAGYLKWGLVPAWAKDPSIGHKLINARGETLAEKPSFKQSFSKRRCLIVANGFYEWKRDGKGKIPMYITFKDKRLFAFAGLWETFQNGCSPLHTCTVITTTPNELVQEVHDRMPVILPREKEQLWLDRSLSDVSELQKFLQPFPEEEMLTYQVSSLVNSPKNEGSDLLTVDEPPRLF
ncbi:SOS response-associated peptidase [Anaerobacillus alkaliphilus]|uniref:Abasic site processing protein n=1 Tax=Anaerobacillus alkaliphilus TaxID=1548597 RepID=A0A4V1LGY0_9BACI|nr:SOS response-associated peptidase [Anaerobacillus alkaliphilus]RXJ04305.1 SOS response-associated peptidase [Anaerobacillus alkaliphilus]